MTISPVTPLGSFPYTMTQLTNVSAFSYRDGRTYLEVLYSLRDYINDTLVPVGNANLEFLWEDFQTGIANAEATVNEAKAGWQAEFDDFTEANEAADAAFIASINTLVANFQATVNASLAATEADITAEKAEWLASFNTFMANVEAELAALNETAVTTLINTPGSDVDLALRNIYAPKVGGGYLSLVEAEADYAKLSSLAATFRPATTRQQSPTENLITNFQTGHGWASNGTGVTWDVNSTIDPFSGAQSVRGTTLGTGVDGSVQKYNFTPTIDLTNKILVLPVKIVSGLANLAEIRMLVSNDAFTNNSSIRLYDGNSSTQVLREGEWFNFRFSLADITSSTGSPNHALVNSLRITVKDKGVGGSVTVLQFGKLSYYTPASAAYPNGAVTLWFDDSYVSHRTVAAPYLAQYGMVGSAAIICEKIGWNGMTLVQVKELADSYGWEINPHSYTSASHALGFDNMTEGEIVDEVNSIKSWMASNGFGANDHFAYPLGQHSAITDKVVGRYFSTARTTKAMPLETMLPGNRLRTRCIGTTSSTTVAEVQAIIDRAFKPGVWLQIYFHDLQVGTPTSTTHMDMTVFKGIVDYLNTKGCKVVTAGDVWNAGI